jgi:uncharacterized membrane protein YuzA (DUF378 family)
MVRGHGGNYRLLAYGGWVFTAVCYALIPICAVLHFLPETKQKNRRSAF